MAEAIAALQQRLDDQQRAERRAVRQRRLRIFPLLLDLVEHLARAEARRPFYVQVGAHDGIVGDPLHSRAITGRWSGLLLEPSTIYHQKLTALYADRPDMIIRNLGVSDRPAKLTLYRVDEAHSAAYPGSITGCASLNRDLLLGHMAPHNAAADGHICEEIVQLDPLHTILEREQIARVDALIIDVEGHEKAVLDSFDLAKAAPRLMLYEHKHLSRQKNREVLDDLARSGYWTARIAQDTAALHPRIASDGVIEAVTQLGATVRAPDD